MQDFAAIHAEPEDTSNNPVVLGRQFTVSEMKLIVRSLTTLVSRLEELRAQVLGVLVEGDDMTGYGILDKEIGSAKNIILMVKEALRVQA
jgi:hypothetical protein